MAGETEFIPATVFFNIGSIEYKNTDKTTVLGPVPIANISMASIAREGIVCITLAMLMKKLESFPLLAIKNPSGIANIDANNTP
ncbi:hypothetical protein SKB0087_00790 [Anaerococcus nagyae]